MKTKKLMMPLALLFSALIFVNAHATGLPAGISRTGIPFTAAYLKAHHFATSSHDSKAMFVTGRLKMFIGRTAAGLYDDWNITISNSNFSYTWRTTDGVMGYMDRSQYNYYEFTGYYEPDGIPEGTYTVTVQSNDWQAYRNDIVIGGDNGTGSSVWDYNAYDNAYVVHNVDVVDGGQGISVSTTTNY